MEDLTKHQLVLLTLLVSFVTSIATGIITVSLLQEAPIAVTQTINRVVERTIETVTPVISDSKEREVVREIQVVSEEDLVLKSIENSSASIVRIKTLGADGSDIISGLGFVVANGVVVTDIKSFTAPNSSIVFADGKVYGIAGSLIKDEVIFLKVGKPANENYSFKVATIGNPETLKLGQTIIAVSGRRSNAVSVGRVSQIIRGQDGLVNNIVSDINAIKSQSGSPVLNLAGEIIGIESSNSSGDASLSYIPVSVVQKNLKSVLEEFAK